jgi:hypothetical protein
LRSIFSLVFKTLGTLPIHVDSAEKRMCTQYENRAFIPRQHILPADKNYRWCVNAIGLAPVRHNCKPRRTTYRSPVCMCKTSGTYMYYRQRARVHLGAVCSICARLMIRINDN